jgi:Na+:H+ antiporter, NhaA family
MLVGAAMLAMVLANSPLHTYYALLIDTPVMVAIGEFQIAKPLLLWVNDGLMAIFFLMVGLELKRELVEGELSSLGAVALPALGALGGMMVPAGIYLLFNGGNPDTIDGWAIPAATDIAFALGVLMLLGSRVPASLKIFLTSIAIFDDIGAVIIIALFYTSKISLTALIVAGACLALLYYLNRRGVVETSVYLVIGVVMWVSLLKSGVHATLSGVLLAMFIPLKSPVNAGASPLKALEHDLHATIAFVILPVFAFCNAGISVIGVGVEQVFHPVPLGIALGLFLGKQVGVFSFCWLGVRLRLAKLPKDTRWGAIYGIAVLCGIGFTMSLFIGSLAFEESGLNRVFDERLGIIVGSLASGLLGYVVLRVVLKARPDGVLTRSPR